MQVHHFYPSSGLIWIGIIAATIGCNNGVTERVPVAGRVLIDGEPLSMGTIRFVPEQGRPASSSILADGTFDLASESVDRQTALGLPPGKYRVQISASEIIDEETIRWHAPPKHADFRTSGLDVTIDGPTDDLLIELTWGGEEGPITESTASETTEFPSDEPENSDSLSTGSDDDSEAAATSSPPKADGQ